MPQQALYELAEAALGLAPEMQWSVDEGIARRESARLFDRVHDQSTTPAAAVEVFMINMMSKLENSVGVIERRYEHLLSTLNEEQQTQCPALHEFFEFFTGLSREAMYSMSETITRCELAPLFEACYNGRISAHECQDAVFDNVAAKRDTTLIAFQDAVKRLKDQMDGLNLRTPEGVEADEDRRAP